MGCGRNASAMWPGILSQRFKPDFPDCNAAYGMGFPGSETVGDARDERVGGVFEGLVQRVVAGGLEV